MTICLNTFKIQVPFPATETPSWAPKVDRWYQLDQAAFSIAHAYSLLQNQLGSHPKMMILASPRASNDTDHAFAVGGASSPSKFVHTLPNIRAVPLLQVMEWAGPMLCVQNDPDTVRSGVDQALLYLSSYEVVWVVGFDRRENHGDVIFHLLTQHIWGANPRIFENRQEALEQL